MIEIRSAKPRDLARVLEIEAASFEREAWDRPIFVRALEETPGLFFVVRLGRRIGGYSITYIERGAGELVSIAVHPLYRGKGIGEALVRFTLRELSKSGVVALRLVVRVDNEGAIAFYRRLGFLRTRRVRNYYGKGVDGWRMEKRGS